MPHAEPSNFSYHIGSALCIAALLALYLIGVCLRSYVARSSADVSFRHVLLGVPAGIVTMVPYARSSYDGLQLSSSSLSFDIAIMIGYAMIFGMMSRETIDRMAQHFGNRGLSDIEGQAPSGAEVGGQALPK